MYALIKFLINDSIEVAATNWLQSKTCCFWPPKTYDVSFHAKKRTPPTEDWDFFEIKLMHFASTYEEARKKLVQLSNTSDSEARLTTDPDDYGRGKRRPCPKKSSESEEEEEEEEYSQSLIAKSLPALPQKHKTKTLSKKKKKHPKTSKKNLPFTNSNFLTFTDSNSLTFNGKKKTHTKTSDKILPSTNLNSLKFTDSNSLTFNGVEEYGVSHHTSYQPTEHVHAGPHIVHTAPFTSHSPTQILHTPPFTSHSPTKILHTPTASHIACTPTTAHSLRSPTVSQIRTSSSPHTPINSINPHIFQDIENLPSVRPAAESSNSNILERVFGEIYLLKDELSRQGRVLDKILEKMDSQTAPPEPKLQNELLVPFNTVEEVEEFDNSLSNIDVQKDLMMKLRRFGGSMHQDHARRIMRYLFTDSLAESYNWMGNKGKRRFISLKLCNIIIDAVQKESNTSRSEIEATLKSWLRHAKERRCYVKKSENVQ